MSRRRMQRMSERSEWKEIKEFVAACRRQWPGAIIMLRPGTNISPPVGGALPVRLARNGSASRQERREEKSMDMRKYVTGTFISLDDLRDGSRHEKIVDVVEGKFDRPNVKFASGDMVSVNATNGRALMRAFGPQTGAWIGREVELYIGQLEYQGAVQDGVRIRPVAPEVAETTATEPPLHTEVPPERDDDTEIPF